MLVSIDLAEVPEPEVNVRLIDARMPFVQITVHGRGANVVLYLSPEVMEAIAWQWSCEQQSEDFEATRQGA